MKSKCLQTFMYLFVLPCDSGWLDYRLFISETPLTQSEPKANYKQPDTLDSHFMVY